MNSKKWWAGLGPDERLLAKFSVFLFNALGKDWVVYPSGEAFSERCGDVPAIRWTIGRDVADVIEVRVVTRDGKVIGTMDVAASEVDEMLHADAHECGRFPIAYWLWGIGHGAEAALVNVFGPDEPDTC
tara:strand:- start:806 stop:1192 length:387 start_codon:yes stop_codon:yes gene_type:complete